MMSIPYEHTRMLTQTKRHPGVRPYDLSFLVEISFWGELLWLSKDFRVPQSTVDKGIHYGIGWDCVASEADISEHSMLSSNWHWRIQSDDLSYGRFRVR